MFSSVVGVRALANLWYGRKRKLTSISIGTVWRPNTEKTAGNGSGKGAVKKDAGGNAPAVK